MYMCCVLNDEVPLTNFSRLPRQFFSSLPVLNYLQAVLFIKIENNFYEYLIQHSLKSDHLILGG